MKFFKKYFIFFLILAASCSGLFLFRVSAQDATITGQQAEQIRSNCVSTKNTLNQLHASDALLRVNRGQLYESILTKLMDRFNGRLSNNNINNTNFTSLKNDYSSTLDTFRLDYKTYEEHLSAAMNIDCSKQPSEFYNAVALARTDRNQVHNDISKLNQLIDKYQTLLDQFEKDYQTTADGMKN